ncbi:VanZ family protein [Schaalia sp. 19OD2882]|uniref:VanZ family protein n=1 Tax=Schaalia sp. 19OD2882 TaxID=2794089 RepID=UPI001C1E9B96|nr:VanZ family protein [Schaalia sp. 19OD2882]QWW19434.1 VanZ family protein [Schaalia sp. 19OD2882]
MSDDDRPVVGARILLAVYLVLLVWVVLFKTQFSLDDIGSIRSLNLVPFRYETETSWHLREVLDNVVLFIPFGAYLRMAADRIPVATTILVVAVGSLCLELAQYVLAVGASDVTDLITNTVGGALGALAHAALSRFVDRGVLDKVLLIVSGILMGVAVAGALFLIWMN